MDFDGDIPGEHLTMQQYFVVALIVSGGSLGPHSEPNGPIQGDGVCFDGGAAVNIPALSTF